MKTNNIIKKKISDSVNAYYLNLSEEDLDNLRRLWNERNKNPIRIEKVKETWKKKLLESDFNTLSPNTKRKRVKLEQNEKCAKCGLSHWMNEKLSLEVDHIDGDRQNDVRENLEALCPNCHSLTPTWRGRNKSVGKISDEELIKAVIEEKSIKAAIDKVGFGVSGKSYNRVNKLIMNI